MRVCSFLVLKRIKTRGVSQASKARKGKEQVIAEGRDEVGVRLR
jgi:hypothetical protein